jgi:hypothetical protein
MKRIHLILYPAAALIIALTGAAIQAVDTCDSKALKDHAKESLDPFKYDSGKITRLYYKTKDQLKEMEVPVFFGEKYRFVFNTENISRNVTVAVYNKDKDSKGRKQLWSFKAGDGQQIHTWEPETGKTKFFVDYIIPSVNDSLAPGECIVMMLGYK